MRIFIAGQKAFGDQVYKLCVARGHEIVGVSAPAFAGDGEKPDRLRANAEKDGALWIEAGKLNAKTLPDGVDLICAAHSHDFIGRKTREKARLGAEGVSAKELREIAAWGDAHSPVACALRMPPAISTEVEIVR